MNNTSSKEVDLEEQSKQSSNIVSSSSLFTLYKQKISNFPAHRHNNISTILFSSVLAVVDSCKSSDEIDEFDQEFKKFQRNKGNDEDIDEERKQKRLKKSFFYMDHNGENQMIHQGKDSENNQFLNDLISLSLNFSNSPSYSIASSTNSLTDTSLNNNLNLPCLYSTSSNSEDIFYNSYHSDYYFEVKKYHKKLKEIELFYEKKLIEFELNALIRFFIWKILLKLNFPVENIKKNILNEKYIKQNELLYNTSLNADDFFYYDQLLTIHSIIEQTMNDYETENFNKDEEDVEELENNDNDKEKKFFNSTKKTTKIYDHTGQVEKDFGKKLLIINNILKRKYKKNFLALNLLYEIKKIFLYDSSLFINSYYNLTDELFLIFFNPILYRRNKREKIIYKILSKKNDLNNFNEDENENDDENLPLVELEEDIVTFTPVGSNLFKLKAFQKDYKRPWLTCYTDDVIYGVRLLEYQNIQNIEQNDEEKVEVKSTPSIFFVENIDTSSRYNFFMNKKNKDYLINYLEELNREKELLELERKKARDADYDEEEELLKLKEEKENQYKKLKLLTSNMSVSFKNGINFLVSSNSDIKISLNYNNFLQFFDFLSLKNENFYCLLREESRLITTNNIIYRVFFKDDAKNDEIDVENNDNNNENNKLNPNYYQEIENLSNSTEHSNEDDYKNTIYYNELSEEEKKYFNDGNYFKFHPFSHELIYPNGERELFLVNKKKLLKYKEIFLSLNKKLKKKLLENNFELNLLYLENFNPKIKMIKFLLNNSIQLYQYSSSVSSSDSVTSTTSISSSFSHSSSSYILYKTITNDDFLNYNIVTKLNNFYHNNEILVNFIDGETNLKFFSYIDGRIIIKNYKREKELIIFPDSTFIINNFYNNIIFINNYFLNISIEINKEIDNLCHLHSLGKEIPINLGKDFIRRRVNLCDNTALFFKYDTRITSSYNGSINIVSQDRWSVLSKDNGEVEYLPYNLWNSEKENKFLKDCQIENDEEEEKKFIPNNNNNNNNTSTYSFKDSISQTLPTPSVNSLTSMDDLATIKTNKPKKTLASKPKSNLKKTNVNNSSTVPSSSTTIVPTNLNKVNEDQDEDDEDDSHLHDIEPDATIKVNLLTSNCLIQDLEYNKFEINLAYSCDLAEGSEEKTEEGTIKNSLDLNVILSGETEGLKPVAVTKTTKPTRIFIMKRNGEGKEILSNDAISIYNKKLRNNNKLFIKNKNLNCYNYIKFLNFNNFYFNNIILNNFFHVFGKRNYYNNIKLPAVSYYYFSFFSNKENNNIDYKNNKINQDLVLRSSKNDFFFNNKSPYFLFFYFYEEFNHPYRSFPLIYYYNLIEEKNFLSEEGYNDIKITHEKYLKFREDREKDINFLTIKVDDFFEPEPEPELLDGTQKILLTPEEEKEIEAKRLKKIQDAKDELEYVMKKLKQAYKVAKMKKKEKKEKDSSSNNSVASDSSNLNSISKGTLPQKGSDAGSVNSLNKNDSSLIHGKPKTIFEGNENEGDEDEDGSGKNKSADKKSNKKQDDEDGDVEGEGEGDEDGDDLDGLESEPEEKEPLDPEQVIIEGAFYDYCDEITDLISTENLARAFIQIFNIYVTDEMVQDTILNCIEIDPHLKEFTLNEFYFLYYTFYDNIHSDDPNNLSETRRKKLDQEYTISPSISYINLQDAVSNHDKDSELYTDNNSSVPSYLSPAASDIQLSLDNEGKLPAGSAINIIKQKNKKK